MANKGDIQHNLKVGADEELFFTRIETDKSSANYGKLKTKSGITKFPYLTRMTGNSIKGTTESIESNELGKRRTASKKRLGNESAEGSLDIELSPVTFDDNMAACFGNEWKDWTSDNTSAINIDNEAVADGFFITRCLESTGVDEFGNNGGTTNKEENFGTRRLLKLIDKNGDVVSGTENGLIEVPQGSVVSELTAGNNLIEYDLLRKLGGMEDEDLYQEFEHFAIGSMSLNLDINSIVTGSFSFVGTNNPKRTDESGIRKQYGSDSGNRFVESGMTGNKFINNLPLKSTDTDQFMSTEGNLWVNGKNITAANNLTFEINQNLEKKYAILVKKAIANKSQKLDVTGSIKTYVVFGHTDDMYNSAIENATNEILFVIQDKEDDPENLYAFQIFKSSFESPDSSGSATDYEDTYNYTSFEERACRVFRIALPKVRDAEFTPNATWLNAGEFTIQPIVNVGINDVKSLEVVDTLKDSNGAEVSKQTISFGDVAAYSAASSYEVGDYCIFNGVIYRCTTQATTEEWTEAHWTQVVSISNDGYIIVKESAFGTTTNGEIRAVEFSLNGTTLTRSYGIVEAVAPNAVTNLSVSSLSRKLGLTWKDSDSTDVKNNTVKFNSATLSATNFSTSATYTVGKYVVYEGDLYKCSTAIDVAGEWDSAKWTKIVEYNSATSYSANDLCLKDAVLYKAKETATGSWDSTKWESILSTDPVIYETVSTGVQVYNGRNLNNGTLYYVVVNAVDKNGNISSPAGKFGIPSAS